MLGWTGAIMVAGLAFFLRGGTSGTPHQFSFDETYYAKDAWSMLGNGYVREYVEDADKSILNGNPTGCGRPARRWSSTPRSASG